MLYGSVRIHLYVKLYFQAICLQVSIFRGSAETSTWLLENYFQLMSNKSVFLAGGVKDECND